MGGHYSQSALGLLHSQLGNIWPQQRKSHLTLWPFPHPASCCSSTPLQWNDLKVTQKNTWTCSKSEKHSVWELLQLCAKALKFPQTFIKGGIFFSALNQSPFPLPVLIQSFSYRKCNMNFCESLQWLRVIHFVLLCYTNPHTVWRYRRPCVGISAD